MEKLTEVLAQKLYMGGYAAFVWPSFAVAACVIAFMAVSTLRSLCKAQRTLADLQQASANEA